CWFWHAVCMERPGCDLVLAWVMALTGLTVHAAYMPLILAFHLVLISAAGALLCRGEGSPMPAWWVCLLMALSALTTLGTLYQLLAQVPGLALLAACAVFYLRPLDEIGRQPALRHGTLLAVLAAGLMLMYPEVIPFLGLAFLVGLAANRAQWRGLA